VKYYHMRPGWQKDAAFYLNSRLKR
jgi:hypothetical protein